MRWPSRRAAWSACRWAQRELKQAESAFPSDRGRQVKRFGPDGTLKAAFGRPGGRAWFGPYKPEDGFGSLLDIAARDGGFLAVDLQTPARTVAYDDKGTIVREWYGGQTYGPVACPDPEDPSLVYLAYAWGGIIRYKVDYQKRTWKIDAVFDTKTPMWKADDPAQHLFVRRREGKLLLCTSTTPSVFEIDEKNGRLEPMCVLSFPAGGGAAPGEGRYFWRIMGTTHDCIVVGDMENSLQHVWDRDGLWVGRLLESPLLTKGAPPEAFQVCGEQFGGSLHTDPETGEVLFFGSGQNNVPVFRITGWDGWIRKTGTVAIAP